MHRKTCSQTDNENSKKNVHETITNENEEFVNIKRKIYNHTEFEKNYPINSSIGFSFITLIQSFFSLFSKPNKYCGKNFFVNRIPSIKWIRSYKQDYILADILSGMTVGIMHIPQGMAYSLLASLPPIYGLYTSFYPVLIYWIFGTSKHLSMGTFAVISLMVASTITDLESKYVPPEDFNSTKFNFQNTTHNYLSPNRNQAKIMIAMVNMFWVGVIQFMMSIFQLGFITSYLSEPLLNSFLIGCAVHVLTSQLKFVFGLHHLTAYVGAFKIPKTFLQIFSKSSETNLATLIVACISITILAVVKVHINERFTKKLPVPFPIELVIVVFGTLISYLCDLNKRFSVDILGPIPAGLPGPSIPQFYLIKEMLAQTFLTALIAFIINFSLADFFSKKHHYKINSTQELFAYGVTNIFASFFPCFCSGGSLARSCLQDNSGGRTQMVSIYSCIIIGFVLMFLAPLFSQLPQACLASIIIVALKTLFVQIKQLPFYWKVNKMEFMLFLITLLSTTFLDVGIGLAIGVTLNFLMHILKSSNPHGKVLGNIPGTELYKDVKLYKQAKEFQNIKIIRVENELHAINSSAFKKSIYYLSGINPNHYMNMKNKLDENKTNNINKLKIIQNLKQIVSLKNKSRTNKVNSKSENVEQPKINFIESNQFEITNAKTTEETYWTEYERNEHEADRQAADTESQLGADELRVQMNLNETKDKNKSILNDDDYDENQVKSLPKLPFRHLIIDCSPIYFIDSVGCKTIKQLINNFNEIGVNVYLADCTDAFRDRFKLIEIATNEKQVDSNIIYISIHDACLTALKINKTQDLSQKY